MALVGLETELFWSPMALAVLADRHCGAERLAGGTHRRPDSDLHWPYIRVTTLDADLMKRSRDPYIVRADVD